MHFIKKSKADLKVNDIVLTQPVRLQNLSFLKQIPHHFKNEKPGMYKLTDFIKETSMEYGGGIYNYNYFVGKRVDNKLNVMGKTEKKFGVGDYNSTYTFISEEGSSFGWTPTYRVLDE